MNSNPFAPPKQIAPKTSPSAESEPSESTGTAGAFEGLCLIGLLTMATAAFLHSFQIHDVQAYRTSYCIPLEMLGLLAALICLPVHLIRTVWFLFRRELRKAGISAALLVATTAAIAWSMAWDAATLIYMT